MLVIIAFAAIVAVVLLVAFRRLLVLVTHL